jgi:hypothetical protein
MLKSIVDFKVKKWNKQEESGNKVSPNPSLVAVEWW